MAEELDTREESPPPDPLVRQSSLKLLEQRLTIKFIVGLLGAQLLGHFTLPTEVTVPAAIAVIAKLLVSLR